MYRISIPSDTQTSVAQAAKGVVLNNIHVSTRVGLLSPILIKAGLAKARVAILGSVFKSASAPDVDALVSLGILKMLCETNASTLGRPNLRLVARTF
jgi:hypothetical protein